MNETIESEDLEIKDVCEVLFRSATEGLVVVDKNGSIRLVNPRIEEMFGYTAEELIGQDVEVLVPNAQRTKHIGHRKAFQKKPERRPMGVDLDLYGLRKDGKIFPVEISLNHFELNGQQLVMVLVSEITRRKKVIDELRAGKKTAQMYLDIAGTMFILIDANEKVEMINQKGCELLGVSEEEIIGANWFENFLPADQVDKVREVYHQILEGNGESYMNYQNHIITRSGKKRWIAWNNIAIRDESGKITGTLSSGEDITEQKLAEENLMRMNARLEQMVEERTRALNESQSLYKMIARNFPNGVINVLDRDLNYVFVEGMEMYKKGVTGDMLVGTSFLDRIEPSIRQGIKESLLRVFGGENVNFELRTDELTYMINAVGLPNADQSISQILMVSQNITNLKKAEEDIQRSLAKERHLNELKSRFVSMASHEFRTPLTSVMNSISLLSKYIGTSGNEEKQQRHVSRIKSSVHDLTAILNDFLSLDKLEEGRVEIHPSTFDIQDICEVVVRDLEGLKREGQTIEYSHRGEQSVHQDRQLLKNIFNNLLSNAIKYSSEGEPITFKTEISNGWLTAVIRDRGIGIPEAEQHHLFERFFRAKNALNIQGTGLGLNIVKKYLEMAGGSIDFVSEMGKGTEFTVRLPIEEID